MEHRRALALAGAVVAVGASGIVVVATLTGQPAPNTAGLKPPGAASTPPVTPSPVPTVEVTRYVDIPTEPPSPEWRASDAEGIGTNGSTVLSRAVGSPKPAATRPADPVRPVEVEYKEESKKDKKDMKDKKGEHGQGVRDSGDNEKHGEDEDDD
ncbi:hypothetical protein [Streptomyces sp. NPDC005181]|uniref:hypothetical protein n=1 Tax=Streptomyces sp. NPDC005181 TaxID=3156869 RepID=UPI0033B25BFA